MQVITCTVQENDSDEDHEAPEEDNDESDAVENLFATTRSGRLAGNWRCSMYIGMNIIFMIIILFLN